MSIRNIFVILFIINILACTKTVEQEDEQVLEEPHPLLSKYTGFTLSTDLSGLEDYEIDMIPHLIAAAEIMNELFWIQSYGDKTELMSLINDEDLKLFAELNYGPWDRLNNDSSFVEGIGKKPLGANIYPRDMTKEEFEALGLPNEKDQYSMVRRDEMGKLYTIPYHEYFEKQLKKASKELKIAANLCKNEGLKKYLNLRAEALLTDKFTESDIAWLSMEDNGLDIIIGPIENYEDKLYNYRTAYEAYVLVKDKVWSDKLKKYVSYLPQLQSELPVEEKYKKESPNTKNSQLNAYDIIYYAGDCNSGSKTIAVNLPNDGGLQIKYGTRRSQLKNAMKAKFDKILLPLSEVLITADQRKHITFNAFFSNTMFHEVAHGLGIKETINGKGPVRDALQEEFSALEEGKADILGIYMVTKLKEMGVLEEGELMDYYVTFMASIFRSVRFGASSAHGKANMQRFNYFREQGAFTRKSDGTYSVNMEKMKDAIKSLSKLIIELQGDGDKAAVTELMSKQAVIGKQLQEDLDKVNNMGIPVDVVFEQGTAVLGL